MKVCRKCLKKYNNYADTCMYCGTRLETDNSDSSPASAEKIWDNYQNSWQIMSEPDIGVSAVRPEHIGHERVIVRQAHKSSAVINPSAIDDQQRNTVFSNVRRKVQTARPPVHCDSSDEPQREHNIFGRREFLENLGNADTQAKSLHDVTPAENISAAAVEQPSIFGRRAESPASRWRTFFSRQGHFRPLHHPSGRTLSLIETALRYIIPAICIIAALAAIISNWNTISSVIILFMTFWIPAFFISLFTLRRHFNMQIGTLLILSTIVALIFMILYYNVAGISSSIISAIISLISPLIPLFIIIAVILYILK